MKDFNELTIQELKDLNESIAKAIELREAEKKEAEIVPAECLREMPKQGETYLFAHTLDKAAYCNVMPGAHEGKWEQVHYQFQAGLLFPPTPEGKAGAERRAEQGIVPYPENQGAILPEGHKPGFLGLVEVVGDGSGHMYFPIGHKGAAFDLRHDPTKYQWWEGHPKGTIAIVGEEGYSFLIYPNEYKFINP